MSANITDLLSSNELDSAKWFVSASNGNPDDVDETFDEWRKESNFTGIQLEIYTRRYFQYWYFFRLWLIVVGILKVILGLLGLVGYVFETLTMMKSSHFHAVSYIYHKAIIVVEFPVMLIVLQQGVCNFIPAETLPVFIMDIVVSYPLADTLGSTVDIITVFMSLERALSLWSPKLFQKFNQRNVAWICVISSFAVSVTLNFPDIFALNAYQTAAGRLWLAETIFGKSQNYVNLSQARDTLNLAKGVAITVLAVVVETGLLAMRNKTQDSAQIFSRQLCILNLACSIPVTIHAVLYVVYWKYMNEYAIGSEAVLLSYDQAQSDINKAFWSLLENLCLDISFLVSHCLHFYLYLALSTSFRASARIFICHNNKVREMSTG